MGKTSRMLGRVVALCVAFVLGFFSSFGAVAGALYFAYTKVSIEQLREWNIEIPQELLDKYVDGKKEHAITKLTLEDLIGEAQIYMTDSSKLNLSFMIDRYGLILPQDIEAKIPETVKTMPITVLLSKEGMDQVMSVVTVGQVLDMIPEDMAGSLITDPTKDALRDKTLADIVNNDMGYVFEGIELGYVTGVTYEKNAEGVYVVVCADPENPTLMELIAPLDLAGIFNSVSSGNGNVLEVIRSSIGNVLLSDLLGTYMSDIAMLNAIIEGAKLEDVIVLDEESGEYLFDMEVIMEGKMLGTVLGAHYEETEEKWYTDESKETEVEKLNSAIYSIEVSKLMNPVDEEGNPTDAMTVIMGSMDGLLLGDAVSHKYDTEAGKWYTGDEDNKQYASPMENSFYDAKLSDIIGGDDPVEAILGDAYIGEMLGYEKGDERPSADPAPDPDAEPEDPKYDWFESVEEGDPILVTGLYDKLANLKVVTLMNDGISTDTLLEGLNIGEILEMTSKTITNGYYSDDTAFERPIEGFEFEVWYNKLQTGETKPKPADAIMGALAKLGFDEISTSLAKLTLSDVMGYTQYNGEWYTWDVVDHNGEDVVVLTPEEGILIEVAGIQINNMSDPDNGIEAKMKTLHIGKLLGYTPEYKIDPETGNVLTDPETGEKLIDHWKDSEGNEVKGITAQFVDFTLKTIGDPDNGIESKFKDMKIGEVMGYTPEYKTDPETGEEVIDYWWKDSKDNKPEGIMAAFVGLSIDDMSNNTTVQDAIQDIKIADVLGYTPEYKYDEDGNILTDSEGNYIVDYWYQGDDKSNKITGVMAAIADTNVGGISNKMEEVKIGEMLGYEEGSDGKWYKGDDPATGVVGALAGTSINGLNDRLDTIKVGEVLGFTPQTDGDKTIWLDNGLPATGITGALADVQLNQLDGELDNMMLGRIIGYTYYDASSNPQHPNFTEDGWYTSTGKATGVLAAFAGLTVNQMQDEGVVSGAIGGLTLGETLGYDNRGKQGWYESSAPDANKVTGIMATLAGTNINSVNSTINSMTLGKALGYHDRGADGWYESSASDAKKITGIMAALAGTEINNLGSAMDTLTIGDVIPADQRTGLLALIDETAPITDISSAVDGSISNTPLQFFLNNGLIKLDEELVLLLDEKDVLVDPTNPDEVDTEYDYSKHNPDLLEKYDGKIPKWRTVKLSESFNHIIELMTTPILPGV